MYNTLIGLSPYIGICLFLFTCIGGGVYLSQAKTTTSILKRVILIGVVFSIGMFLFFAYFTRPAEQATTANARPNVATYPLVQVQGVYYRTDANTITITMETEASGYVQRTYEEEKVHIRTTHADMPYVSITTRADKQTTSDDADLDPNNTVDVLLSIPKL